MRGLSGLTLKNMLVSLVLVRTSTTIVWEQPNSFEGVGLVRFELLVGVGGWLVGALLFTYGAI